MEILHSSMRAGKRLGRGSRALMERPCKGGFGGGSGEGDSCSWAGPSSRLEDGDGAVLSGAPRLMKRDKMKVDKSMGTGARCGLGLNPGPLLPSWGTWASRLTSLCPNSAPVTQKANLPRGLAQGGGAENINIHEEFRTVPAE